MSQVSHSMGIVVLPSLYSPYTYFIIVLQIIIPMIEALCMYVFVVHWFEEVR